MVRSSRKRESLIRRRV